VKQPPEKGGLLSGFINLGKKVLMGGDSEGLAGVVQKFDKTLNEVRCASSDEPLQLCAVKPGKGDPMRHSHGSQMVRYDREGRQGGACLCSPRVLCFLFLPAFLPSSTLSMAAFQGPAAWLSPGLCGVRRGERRVANQRKKMFSSGCRTTPTGCAPTAPG